MEFGKPTEENREMMRKVFRNADSHDQMEEMAFLYIMDFAFDRGDIVHALSDIRHEKGW